MTDEMIETTDALGRTVYMYAKGKAPKERPRYSTRPITGGSTEPGESEATAPTPKLKKE